jgi:polyisoprenoid-binding protein YceI
VTEGLEDRSRMATFRIVPDRSRVWVDARTSVHPVHGEADGLQGSIEAEVDGGRLDLSAPVRLHLELPVARLTSGNLLYDGEMQRRIQARRYPTITGEAREMREVDGGGRYQVLGDLTFHGVTRSVEGEVAVDLPDERTLVVEGEQVFDVRAFNLEPPKILLLRVHPDVTVRVRVVAERED